MIRPLNDNVVVKLLEAEQDTSSLIVIPDAASNQYAIVLAAGPGLLLANGSRVGLEVKAGDKVLLNPARKYTPTTIDGEKVVFVREAEILAVIE